jgi:DNA-binding CsgD family transcriptional regulator
MQNQMSELIDAIYASALQPSLWPTALQKISSTLDVIDTSISPDHSRAEIIVSADHAEVIGEYASLWHGRDIVRNAVTARVDAGETYTDWAILSKKTIDKDPFYQDFRRKHGIRHQVGRVSDYHSPRSMRFAVQLPVGRPPESAAFQAQFDMIADHVCRAFALSSLSAPADDIRVSFGRVMASFRHAVAIVDHNAKVVFANESLEHLGSDGLQIVDGLLQTASGRDQQALDGLLQDAISVVDTGIRSPFVFVARPSRRQPLLVRAVPLSRRDRRSAVADGLSTGTALVVVVEMDGKTSENLGRALHLRGLTAGEARVAALIGTGLSPLEVSTRLGLTEGTVRTRINDIFQKLGISRQSQLARIVTQIDLLS